MKPHKITLYVSEGIINTLNVVFSLDLIQLTKTMEYLLTHKNVTENRTYLLHY